MGLQGIDLGIVQSVQGLTSNDLAGSGHMDRKEWIWKEWI